jgi:glycosyltransferase involved in cell wall biosynthesis
VPVNLAFFWILLLNTSMNTSHRASISAFIVCCNEERQIRRCLESVKWCDEIIIIDSGSKDRTIDICREYTEKILHRQWQGYVLQKRFALEQCASEWVLNIDADEEVSPELQREIKGILASDSTPTQRSINGYHINRVVFFLSRWWRKGGWYPEYRLRLCRRSFTTWGGEDPHEKAAVLGATARCASELHHYSFTDLSDYVRRMNTLSSNATATLRRRGSRPNIFAITLRPLARFFKFYVQKRGYREGIAGFVVATVEAYAVMLKYAKLWEDVNQLSRVNHQAEVDPTRN